MESMRDINRVMEREIAKGSCPLKLDHIEFGDYSYQEITSKEKLLEVLSYLLRIGDFKQYAGKTILNNVYMDLRVKKPVFKRTKTAMEKNYVEKYFFEEIQQSLQGESGYDKLTVADVDRLIAAFEEIKREYDNK